jgi:hypothetical protein
MITVRGRGRAWAAALSAGEVRDGCCRVTGEGRQARRSGASEGVLEPGRLVLDGVTDRDVRELPPPLPDLALGLRASAYSL